MSGSTSAGYDASERERDERYGVVSGHNTRCASLLSQGCDCRDPFHEEQDPDCRFCQVVVSDEPFYTDTYVVAFHDAFPSAPGHTLIVPCRHLGHIRDLLPFEWRALMDAVHRVVLSLGDADATVGINDGPAAGQTVPHLHVHVIPRTGGDVEDPRGGIRWVIPSTAAYWQTADV